MLMIHKPKCENYDITTIRTSSQHHLLSNILFHNSSLCFRIYADFEAGNEVENSSVDNKTTNIYKQTPICYG